MIERALLDAAAEIRRTDRTDEPFLIATVVRVQGSAYRQPGARMLVTRERWVAGSVSGGCLEGDIVHKGWWRTEAGAPVIVRYDSSVDDADEGDEIRAGLGLGCNGIVDVMIERAGARDPLRFIASCVAAQRRGALATVLTGPALGARLAVGAEIDGDITEPLRSAVIAAARDVIARGETRSCVIAGTEVLIEAIVPPPRLFVLGAGHDAAPVVQLGRAVGWHVIVCTPTARPATRERFRHADELVFGDPTALVARIDTGDHAAVVVMNHDYEQDRAGLAAVLESRARYIGVLGPRHRTQRMLRELDVREDARLHAPVGLELGAETPAQIALAIVAEIQAVLARAPASSLRERVGPIHDPLPVARVAGGTL